MYRCLQWKSRTARSSSPGTPDVDRPSAGRPAGQADKMRLRGSHHDQDFRRTAHLSALRREQMADAFESRRILRADSHLSWDFKCVQHGLRAACQSNCSKSPPRRASAAQTRAFFLRRFNVIPTPKKASRASARTAITCPLLFMALALQAAPSRKNGTVLVNHGGALVILKANSRSGTPYFCWINNRRRTAVRVAYLDSYTDRESRVGLAFREPLRDFGAELARSRVFQIP